MSSTAVFTTYYNKKLHYNACSTNKLYYYTLLIKLTAGARINATLTDYCLLIKVAYNIITAGTVVVWPAR